MVPQQRKPVEFGQPRSYELASWVSTEKRASRPTIAGGKPTYRDLPALAEYPGLSRNYWSLADSALACFRMGMAGSRDIVLIGDAGNKPKHHSALIDSDWQLEAGKGHRIAWMTKCSDAPNALAFTPPLRPRERRECRWQRQQVRWAPALEKPARRTLSTQDRQMQPPCCCGRASGCKKHAQLHCS